MSLCVYWNKNFIETEKKYSEKHKQEVHRKGKTKQSRETKITINTIFPTKDIGL